MGDGRRKTLQRKLRIEKKKNGRNERCKKPGIHTHTQKKNDNALRLKKKKNVKQIAKIRIIKTPKLRELQPTREDSKASKERRNDTKFDRDIQ